MTSPQGEELFVIYALADRLKKTVGEIGMLSREEISGWLAYLKARKELLDNGSTS